MHDAQAVSNISRDRRELFLLLSAGPLQLCLTFIQECIGPLTFIFLNNSTTVEYQ